MATGRIDRESPLPYYAQLKELLQREFGVSWRPGERIPGEVMLCERYGVSRTVVRQALDELEGEGRVVRRKGQGTFVAARKVDESLFQSLTGLFEDVEARGLHLVSTVRALEFRPAPAEAAAELGVPERSPVLYVERLRSIGAEPWALTATYLPHDIAPGLLDEDLTHRSLYALLEDKYGVRLDHGRRLVEAVPASSPVAEALGVEEHAPILLLHSTAWDVGGRAVEYFTAYHRGDLSRFQVHLRRRSRRAAEPGMLVRGADDA